MSRIYSAPSSPSQMDSGLSKRPSKKWSRQEQDYLMAALQLQNKERINWAEVAKGLPGRTGKQCREKWKNDLRPDICKDPWVEREEYILARLHSEVGNQWAEIARFLPGRSENSIKNHWNASLRSKAEAKGKTLLGAYGRIVLDQQGTTSPDIFEQACQVYLEIHGAGSLDDIAVGDDFFQQRVISRAVSAASNGTQGNGGGTVTSSPVKVKIGGAKRRASTSRASKKKSRHSAYDSEDTSEEEDHDYEEEEEVEEKPARRRSSGASLSRRNSSGLPPLPPLPPSHNFNNFNMLYGGDASATIRITSQSSGNLLPPKASLPYGPFGADPFLAFASFPQQGVPNLHLSQAPVPTYPQAQWQGMHNGHAIPSMPTEAQVTLPLPMAAADDLDNWAEFDFAFLHEMAGAEAANPQSASAPNRSNVVAAAAGGAATLGPSATPPPPQAVVAAPSSAPSTHLPPNPQRSSLPPASAVSVPSIKVSTAVKASGGAQEAPGIASTPFKLLTSPGDAFAPGLLPPSTGAGKYDLEALNFFSSLIADAPHPCGLNLESSPFATAMRQEGSAALAPPPSAKGRPSPGRTFFSPPLAVPRASSPDLSSLPPGSPLSSGGGANI